MEQLTDLKAILHSKRANLYYLEHCRVMQKDGRVLYLTEAEKQNQYFNIPIANTTVILLGTGTSITQAAVRMLVSAGVMIGFSGGGGTPLFAGTAVEWLSPQSEYRPTEYLQGWMSFWFDDAKRLHAAKQIQLQRAAYIKQVWQKDRELKAEGFEYAAIEAQVNSCLARTAASQTTGEVLLHEAQLTKQLYAYAGQCTGLKGFHRKYQDATEQAEKFLNHGNYLAYGLAATTLWVLGIPHGCAVLHGKTRRGALVFDVADLVKDALVLPQAFICAKEGATEQEFRQACLQKFTEHKALDVMFDQVKAVALKHHPKQNQGDDAP